MRFPVPPHQVRVADDIVVKIEAGRRVVIEAQS
jgi:hypothetical protein